jgi:hypothetical protein
MRTELSTPFLLSHDPEWHPIHVVLHGTQLHLHRVKKSFFKSKTVRQGRLIKTYSLQHAEIGVAVDFRKSALVPKATFARVLPKQAQAKLYETDPELFEPVREFVFRLRVEMEQLIFCAPSHEGMLEWVEQICAGIDIAPPLEDRHEPRFRSLPRRTRRQRQIETAAQAGGMGREESREEAERRFIEEQEELFRRLYPNLAADASDAARAEEAAPVAGEQDTNEFDREDALDAPTASSELEQTPSHSAASPSPFTADDAEAFDPKTAPARPPMTYNALCRFRRRCAPILLASSPRASHVIFTNGNRYQVDGRRHKLVPFVVRPPRYESHGFAEIEEVETEDKLAAARRPSLARGITGASQWSSGSTDVEAEAEEGGEAESVHTTHSASEDLDRIDTVMSISTTEAVGKGKAKALRMGKVSMSPLKPVPMSRQREREVEGMMSTLAAHAPVLV